MHTKVSSAIPINTLWCSQNIGNESMATLVQTFKELIECFVCFSVDVGNNELVLFWIVSPRINVFKFRYGQHLKRFKCFVKLNVVISRHYNELIITAFQTNMSLEYSYIPITLISSEISYIERIHEYITVGQSLESIEM